MKARADYDPKVADVVNGIPTAKNQAGITLGDYQTSIARPLNTKPRKTAPLSDPRGFYGIRGLDC
jgi:hypothetical protein